MVSSLVQGKLFPTVPEAPLLSCANVVSPKQFGNGSFAFFRVGVEEVIHMRGKYSHSISSGSWQVIQRGEEFTSSESPALERLRRAARKNLYRSLSSRIS